MPAVFPELTGSPAEIVLVAALALGLLLSALGAVVHVTERAPGRAAASRAASEIAPRPIRHRHLTALDVARLSAFRARARLLEGEPLRAPGWVGEVRYAWRRGYSGWILACLAGAFSMATHFGVWWLAAGGGWTGAVLVTLFGTALMVSACAWIGLGLIAGR